MIRPMTTEDIHHIREIVYQAWEQMDDGTLPQETQIHYIDRSYGDFMLTKRMEKTIVLVVEYEGIPIGFANFTEIDEDGDAEITAMYILPAYQRAGYGSRLLQATFTALANVTQLFAYVDGNNEIGRAFYEKNGFQLLDLFDETFEGHPVETAQYVYVQASNKD